LRVLFLLFVGVLRRDLIVFPARRSLAIDSLSGCLRRSFGIVGLFRYLCWTLIKYYVSLYNSVEMLNNATTSKKSNIVGSSKQF